MASKQLHGMKVNDIYIEGELPRPSYGHFIRGSSRTFIYRKDRSWSC